MLKTLSGRVPSQNEQELTAFIDLLNAEGCRAYAEIGAREGDTFHEIMTHLPKGSKGVALDLPGGRWGNVKTADKLRHAVDELTQNGYKASYILGDSQAAATIKMFSSRGPYDAILIDGDHTLDAVTADWKRYRDFAPLIAFHDIAGTGEKDKNRGDKVEVPLLWSAIKSNGRRTVEFIAPDSKMGIGVVWT